MVSESEQRLMDAMIPNGQPADVRRIEFELLDGGCWRWRLSTPDGPIFSVVVERHEIEHSIDATELMVQSISYSASRA